MGNQASINKKASREVKGVPEEEDKTSQCVEDSVLNGAEPKNSLNAENKSDGGDGDGLDKDQQNQEITMEPEPSTSKSNPDSNDSEKNSASEKKVDDDEGMEQQRNEQVVEVNLESSPRTSTQQRNKEVVRIEIESTSSLAEPISTLLNMDFENDIMENMSGLRLSCADTLCNISSLNDDDECKTISSRKISFSEAVTPDSVMVAVNSSNNTSQDRKPFIAVAIECINIFVQGLGWNGCGRKRPSSESSN